MENGIRSVALMLTSPRFRPLVIKTDQHEYSSAAITMYPGTITERSRPGRISIQHMHPLFIEYWRTWYTIIVASMKR